MWHQQASKSQEDTGEGGKKRSCHSCTQLDTAGTLCQCRWHCHPPTPLPPAPTQMSHSTCPGGTPGGQRMGRDKSDQGDSSDKCLLQRNCRYLHMYVRAHTYTCVKYKSIPISLKIWLATSPLGIVFAPFLHTDLSFSFEVASGMHF